MARKRNTGSRVRVTLNVSKHAFIFAAAFAKQNGYFGAADFLNATLNMALLRMRDDMENEKDTEGKQANERL